MGSAAAGVQSSTTHHRRYQLDHQSVTMTMTMSADSEMAADGGGSGDSGERVVINVSGLRVETRLVTLERFPDTLLEESMTLTLRNFRTHGYRGSVMPGSSRHVAG